VCGCTSVEDRLEIMDVLSRYCHAVDSFDWPRLRSCFTDEAVFMLHTRLCNGVDDIVKQIAAATEWVTYQQHMISNYDIRVDGDMATSVCYLHSVQVGDHVAPNARVTQMRSTYRDTLVRTLGGWKIADRVLRVGFRQDLGFGPPPISPRD
jgi:3-phenylpropionate/cinnamic acid dioxygenase small subunit